MVSSLLTWEPDPRLTSTTCAGSPGGGCPARCYDFVEGGAGDELTVARNRAAFERLLLQPRVLVDVSKREQATVVLGERVATPVILSPTGMAGLSWPKGEVAAARGSSRGRDHLHAQHPLELLDRGGGGGGAGAAVVPAVRVAEPGPDAAFVERARAAGYRALLLTVDVPVISRRERDLRNGFTVPPRVTVRNVVDTLRRVGLDAPGPAAAPRLTLANLVGMPEAPRTDIVTLAGVANRQVDPSIAWADLAWFRSLWSGPLLLKGVLTAADARRAAEHGVDGLVVSNHGGRQLDGSPRDGRGLAGDRGRGRQPAWRCCWMAASGAGRTWSARSPSGRGPSWSAARTSTAWRSGGSGGRPAGARDPRERGRPRARAHRRAADRRPRAEPRSPRRRALSPSAAGAASGRDRRSPGVRGEGSRRPTETDRRLRSAVACRSTSGFPSAGPIPEVADVIARCEDAGFDGVGVHDHPHSGRDAYLVLALAAERTRRIRLYPATSSPIVRHPVLLASLVQQPRRARARAGRASRRAGLPLGAERRPAPRATVDDDAGGGVATRRLLAGESVAFGDPPSRLRNRAARRRRRSTFWPRARAWWSSRAKWPTAPS